LAVTRPYEPLWNSQTIQNASMTTKLILQQARQAKNIANDLNSSVETLFKDHIRNKNDQNGNSLHSEFTTFTRQLITLHAYLDDLLEQLEWCNLFRQKLKREFSDMGWFVAGAFLGMFLSHLLN
jgi:hypothetical protein